MPFSSGAGRRSSRWLLQIAPGLSLTLVLAGICLGLGRVLPTVGGPVIAILAGAALTAVPGSPRWTPGYDIAARPVLQLSIVVLGTGLSLQEVLRVGGESFLVMLGTLLVALAGAWVIGRLLHVTGDICILIGVGTGICGASAIAATSAVIRAKDVDTAYAMGTIFTFNIAAVLIFPPIGHLLGMSPEVFGLWAGTAINDTSSVLAAAYSFGQDSQAYSIVVKLTRATLLIPIVLVLAVRTARRDVRRPGFMPAKVPWRKVVPVFLIGYLVSASLQSLGAIPSIWRDGLALLGAFLVTTAMVGIGLSLRVAELRSAGHRPMVLGALLWFAVAAGSLGLQALTGQL